MAFDLSRRSALKGLMNGATIAVRVPFLDAFLDGFFLDDAPEFERWVDRERDRLSTACGRALEELAEAAEQMGDAAGAVERWKARAVLDPLDSRVALRVIRALERAGSSSLNTSSSRRVGAEPSSSVTIRWAARRSENARLRCSP